MKTVVTISPSYRHLQTFIQHLPSIFEAGGISIYKARNEIKTFEVGGLVFTVKSYKKPHLINKIVYGMFRQSKAKRAFLFAGRLLQSGISTPEPVAYVEQYKAGLLTHSYFVSLFVTDAHILRELHDYQVEGNEVLLKSLAGFTARMHDSRIYPIDYSPGNVLFDLYDGQFKFTLLDINRMKFCHVSERMAGRSFRRLCMQRNVLEFIAKEYAVLRGYQPDSFVADVVKHHIGFWKRH
jgi:hypothetical protein